MRAIMAFLPLFGSSILMAQKDLAYFRKHPEHWPTKVSITKNIRSELLGIVTETKAGGPYSFIEVEKLLDYVKLYNPEASEGLKNELPVEITNTDFLEQANAYLANLSNEQKAINYETLNDYQEKWPEEIMIRRSHKVKGVTKGKTNVSYGDMARPLKMSGADLVIEVFGDEFLIDPVKTNILSLVRHGSAQSNANSSLSSSPIKLNTVKDPKLPSSTSAGTISDEAIYIEYDRINDFKWGFAKVQKGRLEGYINKEGQLTFDLLEYFPVGVLGRTMDLIVLSSKTVGPGAQGLYNLRKGAFVVPIMENQRFNRVSDFFEVSSYGDGSNYLIDADGNKSQIYKYLSDLQIVRNLGNGPNEGRLPKMKDHLFVKNDASASRYGFGKVENGFVIQPIFSQASAFHEGLAAVLKVDDYGDAKWGFINEKGDMVIPPIFSKKPGNFHDGLALVYPSDPRKMGFKAAYIDKTGNPVIKLPYSLPVSPNDPVDFYKETLLIKGKSYFPLMMKADGRLLKLEEIYKDQNTASMTVQGYNPLVNGSLLAVKVNLKTTVKDPYTLMDLEGKMRFAPVFKKIGPYDDEAGLAYAEFVREDESIIRGYIDADGIFRLVLKENSSGW